MWSGKTAIALSNGLISDLDHFIDEQLLKEMQRPQNFVRDRETSIYLAVDWNEKDGSTKLPNSAKNASTVQELLQYFKPPSTANGIVMYLICERRTIVRQPSIEKVAVKKEGETSQSLVKLEASGITSQHDNRQQRLRLICKVRRTICFLSAS